MKFIRWFATGVGYAVLALVLIGAAVPGINFRLCVGASDRCLLAHERP